SEAGTSINELDEIAHAFDYSRYEQLYSLDSTTAQAYTEGGRKLCHADVLRCPDERESFRQYTLQNQIVRDAVLFWAGRPTLKDSGAFHRSRIPTPLGVRKTNPYLQTTPSEFAEVRWAI